MHALVFDRFGGPEVLQWRELPDPGPRPGHAVVRLSAAGLNFADIYRRQGKYHLEGAAPWILGYEGAGTIVELGDASATDGLRVGQRVGFADSPHANAEKVLVAYDKLIPLPDEVSFETAAGLLLQGLTAQYLVRDSFSLRPGHLAVVWAAGGGVGLCLCQMAASLGARVVAIASTAEKRAAASAAGAHAAFGYENWQEGLRLMSPSGADVVYDAVGSTLPLSLAAARTGGTVVFYGMADRDPEPIDPRQLMDRSLTLVGGDLWNILVSGPIRRQRAAELFALVGSGQLGVRIAARVPLSQGADAHRLLEGRGVLGKVLLMVE